MVWGGSFNICGRSEEAAYRKREKWVRLCGPPNPYTLVAAKLKKCLAVECA